MAGENRTPDKAIGEVKFAQERAAHTKEKRIAADRRAHDQAPNSAALTKEQVRDGDNRTPDKTIGEVKYAQVSSTDQK